MSVPPFARSAARAAGTGRVEAFPLFNLFGNRRGMAGVDFGPIQAAGLLTPTRRAVVPWFKGR
jgi:hypothetical protein